MSEVVHFPNARRIREEACGWIARIDAGLSDDDRSALNEWLARSPEHRNVLLELSSLWDEMELLSELAGLFPLKGPARRKAPARFARSNLGLAATAAGVVALLGVWLAVSLSPESPEPATPAQVELHETDVGQQSHVRLADGSVLTLNTNTRLRVEYTDHQRMVVLERGEATFDVAHDATRPFAVYAGRQVVQAIGTVFNVQLKVNDELEVAVTEGRVRVLHRIGSPAPEASAGASIATANELLVVDSVVSAGQAVVVEDDISTLRRLEPEDIDVDLAWQRGMLIFRGDPLETVLGEVGRYTTVEFELADDALAAIRVGGYFRAGEIDSLLLALRENFNIHAERSGDKVILRAD